MFFARASSTLLARSSALRSKFSSAGAEEAAASGGLLAGAVATTFGTYCLADFLSNFIQHPTQKVSFALDCPFNYLDVIDLNFLTPSMSRHFS